MAIVVEEYKENNWIHSTGFFGLSYIKYQSEKKQPLVRSDMICTNSVLQEKQHFKRFILKITRMVSVADKKNTVTVRTCLRRKKSWQTGLWKVMDPNILFWRIYLCRKNLISLKNLATATSVRTEGGAAMRFTRRMQRWMTNSNCMCTGRREGGTAREQDGTQHRALNSVYVGVGQSDTSRETLGHMGLWGEGSGGYTKSVAGRSVWLIPTACTTIRR